MGEAAGPAHLLGEEVFDLPVDAPQVLLGPAAQSLEEARIEPQEEAFASAIDQAYRVPVLITGVGE